VLNPSTLWKDYSKADRELMTKAQEKWAYNWRPVWTPPVGDGGNASKRKYVAFDRLFSVSPLVMVMPLSRISSSRFPLYFCICFDSIRQFLMSTLAFCKQ